MFRLFIIVSAILIASCDSGPGPETDPPAGDLGFPALRRLAPFPVGAAVQASQLAAPDYARLVGSVFSSLTAEYQMKQDVIWPSRATYVWGPADAIVAYAETREMQVHGHALLWHQSTPPWLEDFTGDDEAFEALVRGYVATVVERYRGRVASWDVVNEAFDDGSGNLRDTPFSRRMGADYLARAFQYAREADPDVLLFYNDYNLAADPVKRNAVLAMVDDFQARGIPIDGVGLQMHVSYDWPSVQAIEDAVQAFASRGLKVHLSELDVRANPDGALTDSLTQLRSLQQQIRVYDIVRVFLDLPAESRYAVTTWGVRDPDSWLIDFWGNPEWPLLFDADFRPKPAYFGFVEALEDHAAPLAGRYR